MGLHDLIQYYNLCYKADNKDVLINNIFSKSYENKYFFENIDEELITGYLPYYPLEQAYAQETAKKIHVNSKEKELVYASTFVVGYDEGNIGNTKRVCSPLFTFPAKIVENDNGYCLEIDTENIRINYQIFNDIKAVSSDASLLYSEIFEAVNNQGIDGATIHIISNIITNNTSNIDTSALVHFPYLSNQRKIKNIFNRKSVKESGQFFIVTGACLTVIKKSINTRGIINELQELSTITRLSNPIKTIFGANQFTKSLQNKSSGHTPAILSDAQTNIIDNSEKFPFTTIVGPPGTGKTYTIAALAIDKISQGKSVLIVSKTDKAVDIIAEKIENQLSLKQIVIRAGRSSYKKELEQHLNQILTNYDINKDFHSRQTLGSISRLKKEISKTEKYFDKRVKNEIKWSEQLEKSEGFMQKLRTDIINWRNRIEEGHLEIIKEFYESLQEYNSLIIKYIHENHSENIIAVLKKNRETIKLLLKALKSRLGTRQAALFKDINFKTILKVFPIWLVKMSDIYKVLPLQCEMFDYVIIDEATQCDIASTIPCLQRGNKAIITGDPKQLRHFSFLSKMQQDIFIKKLNLDDKYLAYTDYRNDSILDIVMDSSKSNEQFVFLDEHYRSLPAIIDFSNKNFYDSKLKTMTSRPYMPINKGIEIVKTNGTKLKQSYNQTEADYVIDIVGKIITSEQNLNKNICSSLGILSPLRDQVEYISKLISAKFTLAEIEKHRISVETPYGFQGDERDIMIISFAVDNNSNHAAFRYIDKADVFNVAITRACKQQYIVHSIDTQTLKVDSLLRKYIESFEFAVKQEADNQHNKLKNQFAQEVKQELEKHGFSISISYEVAGVALDLIASKNNKSFGIDLIGFTKDEFGDAFSLERYKMLTRAGLPLYPIAYTYWKTNKDVLLQQLLDLA